MNKLSGLKYFISLLLLFNCAAAFAQGKQANIWHFGFHAGINFNTGSPPSIQTGGQTYYDTYNSGVASISDSSGNLLFYGDGNKIWNKLHLPMTNGNNLGTGTTQGAIIVPNPGNANEYYYFNFGYSSGILKFQYSVVNMSDGIGHVVSDKKGILLYHNTSSHLSAVKSASDNSIWVICHERNSNCFLAYKVTSDSLCTIPVKSYAGSIVNAFSGYMKISPNGRLLGLVNHGTGVNYFNILSLNPESGEVSEDLMVHNPIGGYGCEFSPDNTKFYVLGGLEVFYQYNLKAGDAQAILDSQCSLSPTDVGISGLQLGPDGKIYLSGSDAHYLGVINDPNKLGWGASFVDNAIYLGDGNYCSWGFPSFIQSYLNDPEFSINQHCLGTPTQFTIEELNGIDSVEWKFNDMGNAPNDTSTLFSPLYQFSSADTFYVELTVHSGLIEKTVIDTVIIYKTPTPHLGADTTFCPNDPILLTLDAGPGTTYNWNGSLTPGDSTFVVTDVGTYTVRVSDNGCAGRDTIIVARYDEAIVSVEPLITPSNCGQSNGEITGIEFAAPEPYTVTWLDALGNQIGTTGNDLVNLPAGSYTAQVIYGFNCITEFTYAVYDLNGPVIASALAQNDDHCNQGLGSIIVTPETGSITDYQFSFNGTDYYPLTAEITALTGNTYNITIKDQFDCISAPVSVVVDNIESPQINCVPTDATGGNANGMITVNSASTNLTYQLDSGPVQTTGVFIGLAPGIYTITVTDAFNCPSQCEVTIENNQGIPLSAMAGGAKKCLNERANSNIRVSGVMGVKDFTASLAFDGQKLQCIHFNDSLAGIIPTVYPAISRVVLEWHGSEALPSNDTISLGELVFETLQEGFADINWNSPPETNFTDENGNAIYPQFHHGQIQVHELPVVELENKEIYCQGDNINLVPQITGGTSPMTWQWNTPEGIKIQDNINIDSASTNHSGHYTYSVVDYFGCVDEVTKAIQVTPLPTANFPTNNGTIPFEQTYLLEATEGYASYEWNTGDTIYYITVKTEGDYTVTMKTAEGCEAIESVYMFETYIPIQVPNAFTPNGDGLNDSFKPIVNTELVRQFSMSIYNKWGQRIFDTTSASEGWDGNDVLPGVYNWVISYSNVVGKVFQLKGSVSLVK